LYNSVISQKNRNNIEFEKSVFDLLNLECILNDENLKLKEEYILLRAKYETLLESTLEEKTSYKESLVELRNENNNLTVEVKRLTEDNVRLENENKSLRDEIAKLNVRVSEQEARILEQEARILEQDKKILDLQNIEKLRSALIYAYDIVRMYAFYHIEQHSQQFWRDITKKISDDFSEIEDELKNIDDLHSYVKSLPESDKILKLYELQQNRHEVVHEDIRSKKNQEQFLQKKWKFLIGVY